LDKKTLRGPTAPSRWKCWIDRLLAYDVDEALECHIIIALQNSVNVLPDLLGVAWMGFEVLQVVCRDHFVSDRHFVVIRLESTVEHSSSVPSYHAASRLSMNSWSAVRSLSAFDDNQEPNMVHGVFVSFQNLVLEDATQRAPRTTSEEQQ
jgi:hypothetical protein